MSDSRSLFSHRLGTDRAFEPGEDVPGEVQRRKYQGLLALNRGDYPVAVEWLEQALVSADAVADRAEIVAGLVQAVRCVAEHSPGPLAYPLYRRARRLVKWARELASQHPAVGPWVLREAALLAAERGRKASCRSLLDQSLEEARRLEQPREAALTLLQRGSLGSLWGWPEGHSQLQAAQQALRNLLPLDQVEPVVTGQLTDATVLDGLLDWSCRLAKVPSSPLLILRQGLERLLPADSVAVMEHRPSASHLSPVLRQVVRRRHVVVGTSEARVVLGAPVVVHGVLQHLVLAERSVGGGPFDTRDVLLTQFLTGLAGAALETEGNFAEQDRLQERLTDSERHFREVFQGVDVGLALVGQDDVMLEVNQTLCALLGATSGQLVGRKFSAYLHPLDRAFEERRFEELVGGRTRHYQVELRFLRADMPAWAQLSASPLPGSPHQIVRTLADLSFARIQVLMELEEQERTWLATDLHDAPGQTAAALCFQLQALAVQNPSDRMRAAVRDGNTISATLRGLLGRLANPVLSGETLRDALVPLVKVDLETEPGYPAVVYRVVCECLAAVPGVTRLSVRRRDGGTQLAFTYQGGFRSLTFLRHRCLLLGGELRAEPGSLVVDLPF